MQKIFYDPLLVFKSEIEKENEIQKEKEKEQEKEHKKIQEKLCSSHQGKPLSISLSLKEIKGLFEFAQSLGTFDLKV